MSQTLRRRDACHTNANTDTQFSVGGRGHRSELMTHRHYGLRWTKRPRTNTKASAGESAMPFVVGIVAMMIVVGVVMYGISKTVIDVANTTASPPGTTGEGTARQ